MPERSLGVWLHGKRIGRLDQDTGRLVFAYDAEWLSRSNATRLSGSLPLRSEPYDDREARPFFAGLLPEQEKRDQIARAIGVSARNDFALLDAIGGECAGAVTLVHPGATPVEEATDIDYHILEDREVAAILDRLPDRPLPAA